MSTRKYPLTDISQFSGTPRVRNPTTPFATSNKQLRYKGSRSAESSRRSAGVRPGSARGILRRLAKLTAPTTKRRVLTPTAVPHDKENLPPQSQDYSDDDLKVPKFTLNVENSIEGDSELLLPPTPSAVLRYSDDEDDQQPTLTFLKEKTRSGSDANSHTQTRVSLLPQSESAIHNEDPEAEDDGGESTFLTERGRRAVSEEPTRMSRYSFGSIRMSDFGSELEIRRVSDRKKKLAEMQAQDDYEYGDDDNNMDDMMQLGGETENLRSLQRSPSVSSDDVEETLHVPVMADDSFQLDAQSGADLVEHENAFSHQRIDSVGGPVLADSMLEINDVDSTDNEDSLEVVPPSGGESRRQTLLESVAAAAGSRPRKKLKMNQKGNMVPCLPSSLIKRIVKKLQEKAGKRKLVLGKDHMKALEQASEWFFEQVGEDLATFSRHSKRKKRIDTSDVLLLMRRQRVLRRSGELKEMAREWLPREILDNFDFSEEP